ncbi:MAG: preprotein translocase subunit SecA [Chloroflexota bacterium]
MFKWLGNLLGRLFNWLGSLVDSNEKELKRLRPLVERTNALEAELTGLSDVELGTKSGALKSRARDGESLDEVLPEAYALVREAARRRLWERHFDVQLMGGIVLHQGKIAEMKTGEGKTLVATLPLYLNSLTGQGCHLVTVNDYLAKRDCHWMGPVFSALGASVACLQHESAFLFDPAYDSEDATWKRLRPITRKQAYEADITYGTNNEFGFDYLRDNMAVDLSQYVQRSLAYAIVDEVDNILIDEARTPLIISGAAEEAAQRYSTFARIARQLEAVKDYALDEKTRTVSLTEDGMTRVEGLLRREKMLKAPSLYDPANYSLTLYLENAIKANAVFKKDRDYVVKNGQVIIVDEFTGRLMLGRRYSEGLHQAIEAKEGAKIQRESVTMATITLQNYFRMYKKLAGMTGTAATEAEEFYKIYKLDVVVIPTHKPMVRVDHSDQIFKNEDGKFTAAAAEIERLHKAGAPVLVGTLSIEKSELLSELLKRRGVPHQVLNAKHHEREATIISQAGRVGAVTVATNMAGRGVDIVLGGNPQGRDRQEWLEEHNKVVSLGGLSVVGTERHEARRIDNQLRGRSGRQGDSGSSRFFVSLEDDIMRRFGGDRLKGVMEWAKVPDDVPIEHAMVNRAIESAQVKIEGYNFDMRKHLVEYDDVINRHREVIYGERRKILGGIDMKANILSMVEKQVRSLVSAHAPSEDAVDIPGLLGEVGAIFPLPAEANEKESSSLVGRQVADRLVGWAKEAYEQKEAEIAGQNMRLVERLITVQTIDRLWIEHLTAVDHMRQGVGLHAVGQRDPLAVYKKEGHSLFESLLASIEHDVTHVIYHVTLTKQPPRPVPHHELVAGGRKAGRNDPCPCGSGKKYKQCCGK